MSAPEKVTTKRSTRITFLGCCNLPQQKALALRDSLQNIISHLSNLHAACDDAKIEVAEKQKTIKDLTGLAKEVDVVEEMGKAQVDLCASEADIHSQLSDLYTRIKANADAAKNLFKKIGGVVHKGIEQEAAQVVDILLAIVRDTVDLLRIADKFTIRRIEKMCKELSSIAEEFNTMDDPSQFADLDDPFSKYSAALSRLVDGRADTIDEAHIKTALENASKSLADHTPILLTTVRNNVNGHKNPSETSRNVSAVVSACNSVLTTLNVAPEFAVMFDVDYIDTELALKLAALSAAIKAGDAINTGKHSRAISAEVEKQVKIQPPEARAQAAKANEALADVMQKSKHALQCVTEKKPTAVAAENQLHQASNELLKAYHALPVSKNKKTSTHLIKAAQELSAKLHGLLI